jgi:hypothetical protein
LELNVQAATMNWADMGETSPGVLFKILSKQSSRSMREANRENQVDEVKIHFFPAAPKQRHLYFPCLQRAKMAFKMYYIYKT